MSWWRTTGCCAHVSPWRPASSGIGSVQTSWCCTATSGIGTPASAPTVGPQMPAHSSTRSHSTPPRSVSTPCTRPCADIEPGDGDAALEPDAGGLGLPRERLAIFTPLAAPSLGTQ